MTQHNGDSCTRFLDFPFFTLKYRDGVFERGIPAGARDMGGGVFRQAGNILKLPEGVRTCLAEKTINAKQLLSLLNSGVNRLFTEGPRLARDGERLMELCASPGPVGALCITLRTFRRDEEWLPLAGLPRFMLCGNVIYGIIDDGAIAELFKTQGKPDGDFSIVLWGEDIPRFAETHGRLVYQFGDQKLKYLLAEENVFVDVKELSLVLESGERGSARPLLRYGERRYLAEDVSSRMDREYILLENRWARREDIEAVGIFPFGSYAGGEPLRLLKADSLPAAISRPPANGMPFPFNFTVEERFSGLYGPSFYTELSLFKKDGPSAPFVPLRLLKGSLDIRRMDEEERAFFTWWRSEFRRGNIIKTDEGYIRIHARELCLFTGGNDDKPEKNFRHLLRLWESYAEIYPDINGFLSRWLVDFAVLYEITDTAMPLLLSCAQKCGDSLLTDIYIYRRFIEENNSIEFDDIKLLIPQAVMKSAFSPNENHDKCLAADVRLVLNETDRYLRENFRLNLFEFFYPCRYDTEIRTTFTDMERAGRSSYTVCGPRFSKHFPLIDFLEKTLDYTGYCFRKKNDFKLTGKPPPLAEAWKHIADAALGRGDSALSAESAVPLFMPSVLIKLKETGLEQLRVDSDAVRQLLAVEDRAAVGEPAVLGITQMPARKKIPLKSFLKKLDRDGREVLRIIAGEENNTELETYAKKRNIMPALLIDKINSLFMELSGDLLIGTVDEKPGIEPEYKAELKKALNESG